MLITPESVSPGLQPLIDLLGTWRCQGRRPASPLGPERRTITTMNGAPSLDGAWLTIRVDEERTPDSANPVRGVYDITYDVSTKQFRALWRDNLGGWGEQTSPGWNEGRLVFVGTYIVNGQTVGSRGTFVKGRDGEMTHTGEAELGGTWIVLVEESCRR